MNKHDTVIGYIESTTPRVCRRFSAYRQPCLWHSTANNWTPICKMP